MGIPPERKRTTERTGAQAVEMRRTARAVLVAGGASTRMGAGRRKPLLALGERTLLEHGLRAFQSCPLVGSIVIVAHPADLDALAALLRDHPNFTKLHALVVGGESRSDSVRAGCTLPLDAASILRPEPPHGLLAIHDAARPFVTAAAVERVIRAARRSGAALLAMPVRDTIKSSNDGRRATHTVERAPLWSAQTPQVFHAARFRACLDRSREDAYRATDDAALWEHYEGPPELVSGSALNFKITDPDDLQIARALLAEQRAHADREEA